mgnify:CR=1 FL=1
MFKKLSVLCFFVCSAMAAEEPQELYLPNDAGGYIILTLEECKIPAIEKQGYHFRVYATETEDGQSMHEGCWDRPDTSDAPRIEGIKIIPVVNTYWETGDRATFQASQFTPEKRRWDIIAPAVEIKPNT